MERRAPQPRPASRAATLVALALLLAVAGPRTTAARKHRRHEPPAAGSSATQNTVHLQLATQQASMARGASGQSVRELLDGSMQHVIQGLSEFPTDFALLNLARDQPLLEGLAEAGARQR